MILSHPDLRVFIVLAGNKQPSAAAVLLTTLIVEIVAAFGVSYWQLVGLLAVLTRGWHLVRRHLTVDGREWVWVVAGLRVGPK